MTSPALPMAGLWERYCNEGDLDARDELLRGHIALVHHVARRLSARVGDAVPYDDLVSAGTIGLVQAADAFDPARGFAFTTYALQRVRGAMLDELRAADWRPRGVRGRGRLMKSTAERLGGELGRPARPEEIAAELDIDVDTYWSWRDDAEGGTMVAFDAEGSSGDDLSAPALADTLRDPDGVVPGEELEQQDRQRVVQKALETLPPRQRLVLSLYFYEELNLKQIAEVLHVTESRISQIRTAALTRLRISLGKEDVL